MARVFNATRLDPNSLQVNTSYDNPFVLRFLRSAPGTSYHSVCILFYFRLYLLPPTAFVLLLYLPPLTVPPLFYCTSSLLLYLLPPTIPPPSYCTSSLLLYLLLYLLPSTVPPPSYSSSLLLYFLSKIDVDTLTDDFPGTMRRILQHIGLHTELDHQVQKHTSLHFFVWMVSICPVVQYLR